MHFITACTLAIAAVAAAAPSFEKRQAYPTVSIFRETDFGGQEQQLPADGSCVSSVADGYQSIKIPAGEAGQADHVWCDIYNDETCDSMYASIRASVANIAFYGPTRIPKGVVCEVRQL